MTVYEPGAVAVATVRGVPNVRLMRAQSTWTSAESVRGERHHGDTWVTEVRPLIVLDLDGIAPEAIVKALRDKDAGTNGTGWARVADQIEAQTKAPRIPEPGLWGVVEAGHKHLDNGSRSGFVRAYTTGPVQWVDRSSEADWCLWGDLIDPVLIRDGIEDGAK